MECSLCGRLWLSRAGLISHLGGYHRIERPEDFADAVERALKPILTKEVHYRCYKFECNRCDFKAHLWSVLRKHQLKSKHLSKPRISTMRVVISTGWTPGDLVFARFRGFPKWPAMISGCPNSGAFFDSQRGRYHVLFFDDGKTTRAWVSSTDIEPFVNISLENDLGLGKIRLRYLAALDWAAYGMSWTKTERIRYFCGAEL